MEPGSVQVHRGLLTPHPGQQGREAAERGPPVELAGSWVVPRPPDPTGNQRQGCGLRLPAAPQPAGQPHSPGSRSVFADPVGCSEKSRVKGVTEPPSFTLWATPCHSQRPRPVASCTSGILHGHGTEVVRAVPESTEIATEAVRVCVSVGRRGRVCQCSWHASPVRVQSPALHAFRVSGHGCHPASRPLRLLAPGRACTACPAPCRRVDILFLLLRGLGRKSPSPPVNMCVHRTRPAQLLACPSLDTVPTARTGSAPHIRLRHSLVTCGH